MDEVKLQEAGPDGDVLRRIAAGETAAEYELVEKYRELVVSAARCSGVPRCDAEEVAQDVLLAMIERARAGTLRDTLAAWLRRVTKNRAVDWKRRVNVRRARDRIVIEELKTARAADHGNTVSYQQLVVRTALQAIRDHDAQQQALGRKTRDAEILDWIGDGATIAELAENLGIEENAARQRKLRALRRLREQVERGYSEPAA